jgi:hypothetical protein
MRTALIDCDVLRYECSAVGEKIDKTTGHRDIQSFDFVKQVFDERIETIVQGAGADDYKLFLSGDRHSTRIINKQRRRDGEPPLDFSPNFREALAKGKVYKGTRNKERPYHWLNLTAYILSGDRTDISSGCEADDSIGIEHFSNPNGTIICTRDKDLNQIPGWHYSWECGKQPEFGPIEYDSVGQIELVRTPTVNKISGGGFAFFAAQLLCGDVVDNIGGLRGIGPVKAYEILKDCKDDRTYFSAVVRAYQERYGSQWLELLGEQCSLLWIVRERHPDGSLKHFDLEQWLNTQNINPDVSS